MATVLTAAGEAWVVDVLDAIISNQTSHVQYVGWGTGVSTAEKAATAIQSESAESRVSGTRTQYAADTLQWVGQLTSASTQSISVAGLLNALTGGSLIVYGDFTPVALNAGDKIDFTIRLEQA